MYAKHHQVHVIQIRAGDIRKEQGLSHVTDKANAIVFACQRQGLAIEYAAPDVIKIGARYHGNAAIRAYWENTEKQPTRIECIATETYRPKTTFRPHKAGDIVPIVGASRFLKPTAHNEIAWQVSKAWTEAARQAKNTTAGNCTTCHHHRDIVTNDGRCYSCKHTQRRD